MSKKWWLLFILLIVSVRAGPQILAEFNSVKPAIDSPTGGSELTEQQETIPDPFTETKDSSSTSTITDSSDSDADGLTNSEELEQYGTDPFSADTDDDGTLDGTEVKEVSEDGVLLGKSDPLHKDLYVHVFYSPEIDPLTDEEKSNLEAIWADMPVENPDGKSGITIHIIDFGENAGDLPNRVVSEGSQDDMGQYYSQQYLGKKVCDVRQVLLIPIEDEDVAGYAEAPGYQSVVDGRLTHRTDSEYTRRVATITHELLHNIVGTLQGEDAIGPYHSFNGWLAGSLDGLGPEPYSQNTYMSDITTKNLNQEGMKAPGCYN